MAAPKVALEYIGTEGAFLAGIPAHDLSEAEFDALSDDERKAALANAASEHAIYRPHTRYLKAAAKEVAAHEPAPAAPVVSDAARPLVDTLAVHPAAKDK